jgi:hypothetical protein
MKRPKFITIASIAGIIFLFSGLSGMCTGSGLEMAMGKPLVENTIAPVYPTNAAIQPDEILAETPSANATIAETFTVTNAVTLTEPVPSTPSDAPTLAPSPTLSQTVPVISGFEMLSYSDTVSPGGTAFAKIQTTPAVACSIQYYTPAGTNSTAQGLAPQTSDSKGYCSWVWNIGSRTKPGTGRIVIAANGISKQFPINVT